MTARDVHALLANFKSLKVQDVKPFGKEMTKEYFGVVSTFILSPSLSLSLAVHTNGTHENCASLTGYLPVQIEGKVL